jgi:hypothetical protein
MDSTEQSSPISTPKPKTLRPKKLSDEEMKSVMGDCLEGWDIISHCVPTRVFRVIATTDRKKFRIQQLDRQGGDVWKDLAQHSGKKPWEAYEVALQGAWEAQGKLQMAIRRHQVEQRQMMRKVAAETARR